MKINRLLQISFVVCTAAMFFSAVAEAQPGGGRQQRGGQQRGGGQRGGPGGFSTNISRAQLLQSEDVQAEIDVNDAQGATITAALEAYREERDAARPDFSSFRDLSEDERNEMMAKIRKDAEELNKKTDEMLNALLEPEQIKRLDEIAMQVKIRMALVATLKSDDVKGKLSITDEQIAKLEAVEKEAQDAQTKMFEEMRGRGRGRGGERDDGDAEERPDPRKMMEEARAKAQTAAMAVLNDDQKSKLNDLKGEELELDMRSLLGGGRGGAGGRGGDRGGDGGRGGQGGRGRGDGGGQQRQRPAADSDDAI